MSAYGHIKHEVFYVKAVYGKFIFVVAGEFYQDRPLRKAVDHGSNHACGNTCAGYTLVQHNCVKKSDFFHLLLSFAKRQLTKDGTSSVSVTFHAEMISAVRLFGPVILKRISYLLTTLVLPLSSRNSAVSFNTASFSFAASNNLSVKS